MTHKDENSMPPKVKEAYDKARLLEAYLVEDAFACVNGARLNGKAYTLERFIIEAFEKAVRDFAEAIRETKSEGSRSTGS